MSTDRDRLGELVVLSEPAPASKATRLIDAVLPCDLEVTKYKARVSHEKSVGIQVSVTMPPLDYGDRLWEVSDQSTIMPQYLFALRKGSTLAASWTLPESDTTCSQSDQGGVCFQT